MGTLWIKTILVIGIIFALFLIFGVEAQINFQPDPNAIPLDPLSFDSNGKTETYSEKTVQGEKKVYFEENFYLITTNTDLYDGYDLLERMESQRDNILVFFHNMTSYMATLNVTNSTNLENFERDLTISLNYRIQLARYNLESMCVKKGTMHNRNPSHIRNKRSIRSPLTRLLKAIWGQDLDDLNEIIEYYEKNKYTQAKIRRKRGLFNPVGKLLNLLWGQGDPDTISEMVDYYETHKHVQDKILETQGLIVDMFNSTNKVIKENWHFVTLMNKHVMEHGGDYLTLQMAILGFSRFQIMADSLDDFLNRARNQITNGKSKFLSRSIITESELQLF